jgi:uncharacterized iron-regulated membrane protein
MKKTFLFRIHAVSGLIAGLFILCMSLSGSVLVFHDEINQLQYPVVRQAGNQPVLGIDSCYKLVQQVFPKARISSCTVAHDGSHPFIFTISDSSLQQGKQAAQLLLHPQTGKLLLIRGSGKDSLHNFGSWLAIFHNSFHLKKAGEWLLGFFSLLFLISLFTGMILYRKKIIAVIGFRKELFRKRNLHQLIGVYALLFNLMIGFTGFWMQRYVFKKDFYQSYPAYRSAITASPPMLFCIDKSLAALHNSYPEFTASTIYFPYTQTGKTAIYGSRSTNSFIHSKKFADAVFLDSVGQISKTAFVTDISAANRYDIINAQIHYGGFGGLAVKILYSFFGLSSGLLSITGAALWIKRLRRKKN